MIRSAVETSATGYEGQGDVPPCVLWAKLPVWLLTECGLANANTLCKRPRRLGRHAAARRKSRMAGRERRGQRRARSGWVLQGLLAECAHLVLIFERQEARFISLPLARARPTLTHIAVAACSMSTRSCCGSAPPPCSMRASLIARREVQTRIYPAGPWRGDVRAAPSVSDTHPKHDEKRRLVKGFGVRVTIRSSCAEMRRLTAATFSGAEHTQN